MRTALSVIVLMVVIVGMSKPVHACVVPDPQTVQHHVQLVDRTRSIVLAKAIGAESVGDKTTVYRFVALEILKGDVDQKFSLRVKYRYSPYQTQDDFDGHSAAEFWDKTIGRITIAPDCNIYPAFIEGNTYLLFLTEPFHVRGFERIRVESDLWLKAIRNVIANGDKISGLSLSLAEYLSMKRSVYLARCPNYGDRTLVLNKMTRLYGEEVESDIRNVNFGDYSYKESGCIGTGGTAVVGIYRDKEYSPQALPIRDGVVDYFGIQTEINIREHNSVTLEKLRAELAEIARTD